MTEKEVDIFTQPYKENYGWILIARSGNGGKTDETYLYHFVDDLGIGIIINPVDKGFQFSMTVDFVFELQSGEFSPLDYPDHFQRNYLCFRKVVAEKILD